MGYISRYIREHYVRRNIRRDLYERFIKWCGERSINICLEKALSILASNIAPNIASNIAPNIGASATASRSHDLTSNTGRSLTSNVSKASTDQPKPVSSSGGGYEWCKPRNSIKNLEGFLKYLERSLGLEDWWEEDNRICFKTRKEPAKTG
jgi:hypothetical protein